MRALLALLILTCGLALADGESRIDWQKWEGAFERAETEQKLVLLDLEAVWCHWCHVMDKTTYQNPEVARLFADKIVAVKVDQDARPDLSNRYQDYGWPATIIFDAKGRELARLSGYVAPDRMLAILDRILEDPQPLTDGPTTKPARGSGALDPETLRDLQSRHFELYDSERGGWGRIHKFINPDVVEYCLHQSLAGDQQNRAMAIQTLDANLALIDPEWGGVYQYSDSGVWDSPHYEKIMPTQSGNLTVYSLAFSQYRYPRYLVAAEKIANYMLEFWEDPEGGFYTSQDADLVQGKKAKDYFELSDRQRRQAGLPRVDRHRYSRENGMAIESLALFSAVSGRGEYLEAARKAARWIIQHRQVGQSGFRHGAEGESRYLGDTLAMGRAFLMLYRVTAQPEWLERSRSCADFIDANFSSPQTHGYFTSPDRSVRDRQENVSLARFANLLHSYTGEPAHKAMAGRALAYFSIDRVTDFFNPGGVLLAQLELQEPSTHITIVSAKTSSAGRALFREAAAGPTSYLRVDWWEPGTPLLPHSEVEYPAREQPAAYLCTAGRCSAPVSKPGQLWKSRP